MAEYPTLEGKLLIPLRIIQGQLAENAGYLEAAECPYSPEIKAFLSLLGPKTAQKSGFLGHFGDKWANLEAESAHLYKELKGFGDKIQVNDVAERMSYFRTATALLEKIISINERALGLKQISVFQGTMLDIIESVLTDEQRHRVMEQMRAVIDVAPTPADSTEAV